MPGLKPLDLALPSVAWMHVRLVEPEPNIVSHKTLVLALAIQSYRLGRWLTRRAREARSSKWHAPRVIRGSVTSDYNALFPQPLPTTRTTSKTSWPASQGIVIGGGLRAGLGPLRIAPTFRYTHWNNSAVTGFFGDGPSFASSQDQVDLMVGIAWRKRVR